MVNPEIPWIDSFFRGPDVGQGPTSVGDRGGDAAPALPGPTAGVAAGGGGSDLIGVGYLIGPEPAEIRTQVAAAFGTAPVVAPLANLDLWR